MEAATTTTTAVTALTQQLVSAQVVSNTIVQLYMLHHSLRLVHRIYQDISKLGHPKAEVKSVDAQKSFKGGVHVLVTGYLTDISKLGHPKDNGSMSISTTMQAINEKIVSLNYVHFRSESKSIDAQESFNGGVHNLDISKFGYPKENGSMSISTTIQAIKENIVSLNYVHFRAEIKSVDAQESFNGGVHVLVTGYLTDISKLGYPNDNGLLSINTTMRAINEKIVSLNYVHFRAKIKSVTVQESFNGGVSHLQVATTIATAVAVVTQQPVSAQVVGNKFVQLYCHLLYHSLSIVHRFNLDISKLGHPMDNSSMSISTNMQAINEKIVSLNYVHFRADIKSVDAQESFNGGDISKLGHPKENGSMSISTTMQAIKENIVSLNYVHFRAEIRSVDAQESFNGGVHILVTGYLIDINKIGHPEENGSMSINTTMQAINEKIVSLNHVHFRAEIKSVDAQESFNGGVYFAVTSYLTGKENKLKPHPV
ncbi:hypothetical protein BUALT_Bualt05G0041800 [Buddleja alternifolia]|uniref:NTF2 domain-containing protein n=1 Tax=Buddleja alternifolia TaxID=168488 RepID=A0AAV6XSC4_9LAMI|nr:hypothetical protein BUALT_Bualt05G0041800 [Buddleja alternifolia]